MSPGKAKEKERGCLPRRENSRGQVLLEFTFCMIIVFFMIYGLAKVFVWTGRDLAERTNAHDALLTTAITRDYGTCAEWLVSASIDSWILSADLGVGCEYVDVSDGPIRQVEPYFYTPVKMGAVWGDN